jgi:hypothetical protein
MGLLFALNIDYPMDIGGGQCSALVHGLENDSWGRKTKHKKQSYTAFYIVDVRFDALFVNAHCCVLLHYIFVTLAGIQQFTSFNRFNIW